jgi:hypothetical protein
MTTKNFEWTDGPDPSRWTWDWDGYRCLVIPRSSEPAEDRIIAQHYGNWVKVFVDGQAVGVRQRAAEIVARENGHPLALMYTPHLVIYHEQCHSWRHGVELVESWLDELGLWGTPDDIRWCGLVCGVKCKLCNSLTAANLCIVCEAKLWAARRRIDEGTAFNIGANAVQYLDPPTDAVWRERFLASLEMRNIVNAEAFVAKYEQMVKG